jgi:hypothetical protein
MKNVEMEQKEILPQKKDTETDFSKTDTQPKKETEKDSDFTITNYLFSFMIFIAITGTGAMIYKFNEFLNPLIEARPDYNFPSIYDLKITLFFLPILCVKSQKIKKYFYPIYIFIFF